MNEEQWNELLKLRAKASLSPTTEYRFERLEDYLSLSLQLSIYSQEEQQKLLGEFNELPDQEKQDLLIRVAKRTHPNFFQLSADEIKKLNTARKELSFHERARLFSNLILAAAGTAWLDLGEVFNAQIEIDDSSSPERWSKPYAHLSFPHSNQKKVETVDILESVKNNPAAIGHPAIAFAIYHWQRVIYAKRVIERDDITCRDEMAKVFKKVFGGEQEVEIAEFNLQAIGNNLLKGAKKKAISKEAAFAFNLELLGLNLKDTNTVFYKAWERLDTNLIDPLDEVEQVLAKIESDLLIFEKQEHTDVKSRRISVNRVMDFLREDGEKGGRRFVGNNVEGYSLRPSWKVFRNAFAAWFFNLAQSVVQEYLEKAAKENLDSADVYQPSWVRPVSYLSNVFHYIVANQLTMARETVTLGETDIGFSGIEEVLAATSSDSVEEEEGK